MDTDIDRLALEECEQKDRTVTAILHILCRGYLFVALCIYVEGGGVGGSRGWWVGEVSVLGFLCLSVVHRQSPPFPDDDAQCVCVCVVTIISVFDRYC